MLCTSTSGRKAKQCRESEKRCRESDQTVLEIEPSHTEQCLELNLLALCEKQWVLHRTHSDVNGPSIHTGRPALKITITRPDFVEHSQTFCCKESRLHVSANSAYLAFDHFLRGWRLMKKKKKKKTFCRRCSSCRESFFLPSRNRAKKA